MTSEWRTIRAADFIDFNPRLSLKKGDIATKVAMDKLKPFTKKIPETEKAEFNGGAKFCNGDTVMARITPCLENGKTAYVDMLDDGEIGFGSTEFIVMRAKTGISDPQFVYYTAINPVFRNVAVKSMVGSSGRQRVQQSVLEELELSVPDLDEQRRIGDFLAKIDEKIALNDRINDNLEQQAMALYRQMFVENNNDARRECRADEYFDISIGKTPPRKEAQWFSMNPTDCIWVSISDMGRCGMYIADSSEYLTHESVDKFNIKVVPDNTVLLSFKLTVGRVAITDGAMVTNEAIAHFKTDKPEINEYLYCYLKDFNYQTMGSTSSIATAVNSKIIKAMPFVIPTDAELVSFHSATAPMFEMIKTRQRENTRLAELRDSLLLKLMSGEIDVSAVQL